MRRNRLAIVRTLSDDEMDIIEDALENWLDDYGEDDEARSLVEKAKQLYEEIKADD